MCIYSSSRLSVRILFFLWYFLSFLVNASKKLFRVCEQNQIFIYPCFWITGIHYLKIIKTWYLQYNCSLSFLFSNLLRFWLISSNNFVLILWLFCPCLLTIFGTSVSPIMWVNDIISRWLKEAIFVITTVMHRLNQHVFLIPVNL